ncbi:cytochrome bd oxidase small subunit CydS [Heyndrickxia shackletonii]
MENFLMFYAPFIIVAVSIILGFYLALKDGPVNKSE